MTAAPPRFLVVDDEAHIRDVVARVLRRAFPGAAIRQAGSGEEALEALDEGDADVVLSDYRMTRMSGADLLVAVNARAPSTRTLLMTGYNEDSFALATEAGCRVDAFLRKPWDNAQLVAAVAALVGAGALAPAGEPART